ncbi:hypothetical protein U1Q18_035131 [Sarracenia purpurea var. burkii]
MNRDAPAAQENSETGKISPPRQKASIQEHEFGARSFASEATEEKHEISSENLKNGSTIAKAAGCTYNGFEQLRQLHEDLIRNSSCEQLVQQLEDATINANLEPLGLVPKDGGKNLSAEHATAEIKHKLVPVSVNCEAMVEKQKVGIDYVENGSAETGSVDTNRHGLGNSGHHSEDVTKNSSWEQLRPPPEDEGKSSLEQLKTLPDNVFENRDIKQLESPPKDAANNPSGREGRGRRTSTKSTKGKHALRSSVGSTTRVLRARSQEKPKVPEPSNNFPEQGDDAIGEKGRKKRKKKQVRKFPVDEFSRIRRHLRYLLHRIVYEQNLIEAYSGEGWKGQSLEKIKPEKELQRAKSEIFRCKLKIRDLFQRLDSSITEGRLPQSLFDSEGQIDSEDIFCAKCGSKDLAADNDIILCDGACERGFHQFCLEPPLLKEHIPPDDVGWLCPGCDCKVDCIGLLNDYQGTKVSVLDTWEKVFPEAAAAAASGNKLDDNFGLPSDDSEDNDYDPDRSDVDEKVEGGESSSEESAFYSASEDIGPSPKSTQNLKLPSDDSEDDNYDPNAPDPDEEVKGESSSSDFTSDSEDFSVVAFNDNRSSSKDEPVPGEPMSASSNPSKTCGGSNGGRSILGPRKKQSLNAELLFLLESGPGQGDSTPLSGKRHVERLDYKKLYDDTYGNDSSDSSDGDWTDAADAPKKRRKHNQGESERTQRKVCEKLYVEGSYNSPAKSYKVSSEQDSSFSSTKKSTYRRLGEAVTQGLLRSFKENQYPERATKENLAKELGITAHQVSKWFENARWSFRHSSRMESMLVESEGMGQVNASVIGGNSSTEGSSKQGSTTPRGRKRIPQSEHQAWEAQKRGKQPQAQEERKRGRPRSRKYAA